VTVELTEVEGRVIGCLMEKERTTPDHYPLTLNALLSACNQKSNREPVMTLSEREVVDALDALRYEKHLVYQVMAAGSRVPKYRHEMDATLGLAPPDHAVISVLLLRGPQTAGEIKAHVGRSFRFESLGAVMDAVESLMRREDGPLVVELPRRPGRRERRFMHALFGTAVAMESGDREVAAPAVAEVAGRADLEQRVADLESEVAALRQRVFGGEASEDTER